MLVDVVESLLSGAPEYPKAFAAAKPFWDQFFSEHGEADDQGLQQAIDGAQLKFQWAMENEAGLVAPFAKSIMALTAIGSLYSDGFEDQFFANRVVRRFIESTSLSLGVKSAAKDVARMYDLELA